ncbi:hypothetical protein HK097_010920, partial [Rhizophlyctis rosea]
MFVKTALTLASLLSVANAHYWILSVDGQTSCLRDFPNNSIAMNPVTGSQIYNDDIVCNIARPLTPAHVKPPCVYNAGSKMTVLWYENPSRHPGPYAVYAAKQGSGPLKWSKIYEEGYNAVTKVWSHDRVIANGNKFDWTIPKELSSGLWVFRIEHVALHGASSPGGSQHYMRCVDVEIRNGGSATPDQGYDFPGLYQPNSPGLLLEW